MSSRTVRVLVTFTVIAALLSAALIFKLIPSAFADTTTPVSIASFGTAVTQNFDTLVSSGTGTLAANTPAGWGFSENTANTSYTAGTGSSNTGDTYSFGSVAVPSDRAFGQLRSGTTISTLGGTFQNNTSGTITSLAVSYVGEQWRLGATGRTIAERMDFQYSTDATSLTTGTWIDVNALDFNPPITGPTVGALDGNAGPNRIALSSTIIGLSIANGASFWIRWTDVDATGADDGLAVDDFSLTASGGDAAPTVVSTTPVNGATNVPVSSNVVINFSESVSATASAFSIQCPTGSPQTFTQSASPSSSFTLTPTSPLPFNTVCTVTTTANQITDTDISDPPDQMAADHVFSFTTANPVDTAPTVSNTTPANGATNVSVSSNVVIDFSESVTATASAFNIQCPTGSPQTFAQSGSPNTTFTLNPTADLPYSTTCTVTVTASQISDTDANDPPDQMASDYSFSFTTSNPVATNVIINEIDSDTPGTDTAEFIELYDGGVGNTSLNGLVVVLFNGSNDLSYGAFDLDGRTTDANGYFVLGDAGVPGVDMVFADNIFQNGADAVALYAANGSDFPNNTAVTTTNLQDAIVYDTDDADDPGLLVLLNSGQPQVNEGAGGTNSVGRCPNGSGGGRNTSTYYQGSPSPDAASNCPPIQPPSTSPILISQVYGGGGNSGATYHNDFVELYNRSASPVDTAGWSIQYTSEDGDSWDFGTQPLGGTIGPGEYYLIALGSGGAVGAPLPPAQINGQINMAATSGKVALVNSFDGLVGNCPLGDPSLMDFVGYGSPDCREGAAPAPAPSSSTSIFRLGGGSTDTNNNGSDFVTGSPNPRQTAVIVELGPLVLRTDPRKNGTNAARDASINVTFTEPVDVVGSWFDITCPSGQHNVATFAVTDGNRTHVITPNLNFAAGEQCTVTIFKDQIHDVDGDDSGANTDGLPANYVWTFTVATGTAPPYPSSVHLTMGDPGCGTAYGCAAANLGQPDNFLMDKPEFTISYNRDKGAPNWVSWHLTDEWIGSLTRVDTFRPDPGVPDTWYRVQAFDFSGSGFDRGHMTPNADRDKETSIPINQATFLMSNMVAQAPDNNQGPWAALEGYLRTLLPGDEVYIVSGPFGVGGTGSNGGVTTTLAGGNVTVPAQTWKVALVIPKASGDDISRVSCGSRTIAVIMPNIQGIRNNPWQNYLTTVDAVEQLTGYDFFQNLPPAVQACVEGGTNGTNPPGTANQSANTAEDNAVIVTLQALQANNNTLTFSIVNGPTSGSLGSVSPASCSSGTCTATVTYTPGADFNGSDSFTFRASDGPTNSNISTVNITVTPVNDDPDAVDDAATVAEDSGGNVVDVLSNDTDVDADTLTVSSVTQGANGSVTNNNSSVTYTPNANFFGADSFTYSISDGNGGNDTATVNVTVTNAQDAPDAVDDAATINEDSGANAIDVRANDSDLDNDTLTVTAVTQGAHGSVAITGGGTAVSYTPAANFFGDDSFTYTISDGNGGTDTATVAITVTNVQDAPDAVNDSATIAEDSGANAVDVRANDSDLDGDTLTVTAVTQGTHGSVAITGGGTGVSYTPVANFFGNDSFTYTINDGQGGSDTATVSVTINNVNDAPVATGESYVTNSNTALNVAAPGVLANDSDIDGPSLSAQLVSNVSHGTLSLQSNGSFTYTPTLNFEGSDSFTYQAYDGSAASNVVTVNITVNDTVAPVITSSVAVSSISSTNSNLINVGLTASATDNSGDPVTIQVTVFGDEDDQTATIPGVVHSPDAKDIGPNNTLRLRGERIEANDGRVYLIIVTATDSSGNVSRSYHTVVVPKNNKPVSVNSVNTQAANAVAYAQSHGGAPPPGYFVIGDGPIIGPKQ
ncbi:MAG TPA: Ig-like domain-containing protein [Pyrinomonadaceae bacterium]|nr:Ig-like domain-containing protein [Pyrinomonadaceae bacterium]